MATRTVIDLGQTPIIRDLVTKLAALGGRFALFESGLAGIAEDTRQALATADAALDASLNPRTIASTQIVNGHLIITYSDGTTQDAGLIGGGVVPVDPTLDNTTGLSTLTLDAIPGLLSQVNAISDRMTAVGL